MHGASAIQHTPEAPAARPGVAAVVLAVVLPLVCVAAPLAYWARPDPPAAKSAVAEAQEKLLASDPDVVILGASKVGTDLDQPVLAKALASGPDKLRALNLSGSTAPVWYAILKNRVYGTGHQPKLVLVYSTFDWVLSTRPTGEGERAMLLAQMGDDEPVLRSKALGEGAGGATWDRVRRRRTEAHSALMGWLRDATVGLAFAPPGAGDRVAAGAEIAAPALESLFGMQANLDLSHTPRAIPIVEQERERAKASDRVEDTFLPDLLAMAQEHHTKLVFVHAPVRQSAEAQAAVDPSVLRQAVERINAGGAGYTDLRELHLGDAAFGDGTHLNRVGRDALTKALIDRLREMGATGDGAMKAAKLPTVTKPPRVTRTGTPPALPEVKATRGPRTCGYEAPIPDLRPLNDFGLQVAGFGMVSPLVLLEDGHAMKAHASRDEFDEACKGAFLHQERSVKFSPSGESPDDISKHTYAFGLSDEAPMRTAAGFEAWWVYPGTTLTIDFDEGGGPGAFGVVVDAVAFGAGAGQATVRVGDASVPLTGDGLQRHAAVATPPPAGPWSLSVSSPPDGGWILLRRVVVGNAADPRFVVGNAAGTSVNVLPTDGAYASAPKPLPPLGAPKDGTPASWDVTAFGLPDTNALWRVASVAGCTPLRLSEDGKPLGAPLVRVDDLKAPGSYTQVGSTLYALGSDGRSPATNGKAYTAALDETRRCRGLRWLYPGDVLTLTIQPSFVASLRTSPDRLEIGGAAVGDTSALATLRVKAGDVTRLDTTFPIASLASSPPSFHFDPPLPIDAPVTVEVSTPPDAPYVLVGSLALSEDGAVPLPEALP